MWITDRRPIGWIGRTSLDLDAGGGAGAAEGQLEHHADAGHARQRLQSRRQLLVEVGDLLRRRGARRRRRDVEGERLCRVESRRHLLQTDEAVDQQARAHQQHQGESDFRHHQQAAGAGRLHAGGRAAPALTERLGEVGLRDQQRRRQTEGDARQERHRGRERQHAQVELGLGHTRQGLGAERDDQIRAPVGEHHPEHAAHARQQHALGQQLADDARGACAERQPHLDLTLPADGALEQQVGHVHAGDQEHECDGAEQQQECGPQITDHVVEQRADADGHLLVRVGVFAGEPARDHGKLRPRLFDRDARLQPPDGAPAAIAARHHDRARIRRPLVVERGADPHLRRLRLDWKPEPRRHHADDGEAGVVEIDAASDGTGVAAELLLPCLVSSGLRDVRPGRRPPHPPRLGMRVRAPAARQAAATGRR